MRSRRVRASRGGTATSPSSAGPPRCLSPLDEFLHPSRAARSRPTAARSDGYIGIAMASSPTLSVALLPGAEELLRVHARELPQRDDFCGAFCGSLALFAAGLRALGGAALDQDEVALAAGTTVSTVPHTNMLPAGESGRRDYRLEPPLIGEHEESGTTATGLVRALEELSEARLAAVPFDRPWSESTIAGLFDAALELEHPATLIANVATRHFWGARPSMAQLLGYLLRGELDGPRPDWDVGHFTCIGARIHGPAGTLYAILDTYPSLGARG